ncbi:uncharacterized protein LOC143252868 isoform X2 [Tachypleus tridentatus]|uniref:uncharacterized protein LOC143252868 isoform X2 n=1 Tax=Tachypleus tridentatus TaxID=6853 RepID=UPI003FD454C4
MLHRSQYLVVLVLYILVCNSSGLATAKDEIPSKGQGVPVEGSAVSEISDLDHSSGQGIDDEDTPGSGNGPKEEEEDEEGSGGVTIIVDKNLPKIVSPEGKLVTPTWLPTVSYPTKKSVATKKPAFPPKKEVKPPVKVTTSTSSLDDENRIPEIQKPVTTKTEVEPRQPDNIFPGPAMEESPEDNNKDNEIHIMGQKQEERPSSFFAQPGILASVIGGAVVGLLCAILLVMFIVYRMRKKDEGSYIVGDNRGVKDSSYGRTNSKEIFA